jgi:hypothetical protein
MRITIGALVLTAVLLGGCGELHPTAYNGAESCDAVGGWYTADGRCIAGDT